jgi:hypothetical protein
MSGRASKPVLSVAPPVTVMGAQFIYISGRPLSFENQVHANVAFPLGISFGSVKSKVEVAASRPGQAPSMDLITLNLELGVGLVSRVMESWQLPPPWTAAPLNEMVCC